MALFRLITHSSGTKTHGLSEVLRTIPVSEMYLPKNLWSLVALSSPSPQTFWRKNFDRYFVFNYTSSDENWNF